ncbi:hypothetical protein [uncultured Aeromonas sp.]|uniref:hypothetical protein n=1 Tax=uncultured Aeromonas sp. TaxID=263763 RepID=UPI0025890C35|nr:hypothetical protein [uncultured Aeromonas sp.]
MKLKSVLLVLVASGQFAYAVPSEEDFRLCVTVYGNCIKQQKSGIVKSSCLSYESDNPEVMKYLKLQQDGLTDTDPNYTTELELAVTQCAMQHQIFKGVELQASMPDSYFKSGVNKYKYKVVD